MMKLTCNMPKHLGLWSDIESFAPAYLPTSICGLSHDTQGIQGKS